MSKLISPKGPGISCLTHCSFPLVPLSTFILKETYLFWFWSTNTRGDKSTGSVFVVVRFRLPPETPVTLAPL